MNKERDRRAQHNELEPLRRQRFPFPFPLLFLSLSGHGAVQRQNDRSDTRRLGGASELFSYSYFSFFPSFFSPLPFPPLLPSFSRVTVELEAVAVGIGEVDRLR